MTLQIILLFQIPIALFIFWSFILHSYNLDNNIFEKISALQQKKSDFEKNWFSKNYTLFA